VASVDYSGTDALKVGGDALFVSRVSRALYAGLRPRSEVATDLSKLTINPRWPMGQSWEAFLFPLCSLDLER
jgi:hypothetical protein